MALGSFTAKTFFNIKFGGWMGDEGANTCKVFAASEHNQEKPFRLTVVFSDGSSIDTYADEPDSAVSSFRKAQIPSSRKQSRTEINQVRNRPRFALRRRWV